MTLKEKLNKLPENLIYHLPSCATSVWKGSDENIESIWAPETATYYLNVRKVDGKWWVQYTALNPYEGYVEASLPSKPDEEILRLVKEMWGNTEINLRWMLDEELVALDTSSTDLEESVDKVLEWLEKERLLK